ncbi:hypothetical protein GF318_05150 [Candidatus Micrarchaeota archaeon]|nr:hypothetical protein [Candidatus Micrarchaeota archaeon]
MAQRKTRKRPRVIRLPAPGKPNSGVLEEPLSDSDLERMSAEVLRSASALEERSRRLLETAERDLKTIKEIEGSHLKNIKPQ